MSVADTPPVHVKHDRGVSGIFARIEERQRWHQMVTDAWYAGLAHAEAAHADDYRRGWNDALAHAEMVAAAQRRLGVSARVTSSGLTRWVVRGERRTRATFGKPHRKDYPGGAVPRW